MCPSVNANEIKQHWKETVDQCKPYCGDGAVKKKVEAAFDRGVTSFGRGKTKEQNAHTKISGVAEDKDYA